MRGITAPLFATSGYTMPHAIFDLDDTLLDGDSDYLWGIFLSLRMSRDPAQWKQEMREFDRQYRAGTVNFNDYLAFAMQTLTWLDRNNLLATRELFKEEWIEPRVTQSARDAVQSHRSQGHTIVVATATNRFVAEATSDVVNADYLLATEPQTREGVYLGTHHNPPCFGPDKISHLHNQFGDAFFLENETWFYSDSVNDLPLLSRVHHPRAVNPDERLRNHAQAQGWPILRWRRPQ